MVIFEFSQLEGNEVIINEDKLKSYAVSKQFEWIPSEKGKHKKRTKLVTVADRPLNSDSSLELGTIYPKTHLDIHYSSLLKDIKVLYVHFESIKASYLSAHRLIDHEGIKEKHVIELVKEAGSFLKTLSDFIRNLEYAVSLLENTLDENHRKIEFSRVLKNKERVLAMVLGMHEKVILIFQSVFKFNNFKEFSRVQESLRNKLKIAERKCSSHTAIELRATDLEKKLSIAQSKAVTTETYRTNLESENAELRKKLLLKETQLKYFTEHMNALEEAQKKKEVEESSSKEVANLKNLFESDKKNIAQAHEIEISNLQQVHEERINKIKIAHEKEEHENALELAQKKKELEESSSKELANLKSLFESDKTNIAEAHEIEISNLQQVHEQRVNKIKIAHEKEEHEIISAVPQKKNAQEELEKLQKLIKEETQKYQDLLKTEIENTENDLNLLRSEKSGLISELNIIKENISNQKANLSNLEKKLTTSFDGANCSKKITEIGINTDLSFNAFISKDVQVSVSCCDTSSQVENILYPMLDAVCQTSVEEIKHLDSGSNLDKNLEKALKSELSMKLDSRINVIENQMRSLQENVSRPDAQQFFHSSQEFMQNQYSKTAADAENRSVPPPFGHRQFSNTIPSTSQSKCKCELGEPESCRVLQDVKNSVYQLNDILCAHFAPPLRSSTLYQVTQPVNNYSSSFDDFYVQLREMQEKQRLFDLKNKCEDSAIQFTKDSSSNFKDSKKFGRFNDTKASYHVMHSDMCTHNVSEDPLIRAKSIVHREKARAWKEQQALQSSVSHIFSMNSSSEGTSSNADFVAPFKVLQSEQSFSKFEVDPETDFNMWMTRLNVLQHRIRSHKTYRFKL